MARIKPLPVAAFSDEMRTALLALHPGGSRYEMATAKDRPRPRNLLGVMAHHPVLANAYFTFNGHLLGSTSLSARQRELVVMRVAAVRCCEAEWTQHFFIARDAGLSDDEISRIASGSDSPMWSAVDGALLCATDELLTNGKIGETTWQALCKELNNQQLLDLISTVGGYDTLAKLFESLQIEIEEDAVELISRYKGTIDSAAKRETQR
jgi:AhpD family alkylhydroperoxidase